MDAIARCGFGLNVDAQQNQDDPFVKHAKKAFDFSLFNPAFMIACEYYTARSSIISLFPLLLNILMENLTLSRNPVYIRAANTTFCTIFDDQIW